MNTKTIIAVVLVALGIVVLAYSGITFKTPGKPVEFLGLHIETTDSHFIPPVVGALALVGGIVFVDTMFFAALTPLLPDYADEFDLSKAGAGVLSAASRNGP